MVSDFAVKYRCELLLFRVFVLNSIMVNRCCFAGCSRTNKDGVSLFKFPQNDSFEGGLGGTSEENEGNVLTQHRCYTHSLHRALRPR